MRNQFAVTLSIFLVLGMQVVPASAEDNIQMFVNSYGKVVFTNLVDNTRPSTPAARSEKADALAEEMPASLRALVETISANHGVDPALVQAVMKTESNFNR